MKRLGVFLCILSLLGQGIVVSEESTKFFKAEALASCGNVLLTWSQVPNAMGYDIYKCEQGQSTFDKLVQLGTDKNFYIDTKNIVSEKSIRYYVTAIDEDSKDFARTPEMTAIPSCYDETACKTILKFQVGNFMYWIDGKMDGPMNAAPEQTNGRVFLVIKYITSTIGAKLDWLASEKKVTITTMTKTVELWIGKNTAKINGIESKIDSSNDRVAPYLSNGRTMLPMRFVADNLGAQVAWEADTRTATLSVPKDCIEPDCYNLKVESYKDNTITGVNSAGFRINFDRSAIPDGTVELEQMVTVCGTFENRDGTIHINSRTGKEIDISKTEWIKGKIISIDNENGKLAFRTCEGKQITCTFKRESLVNTLPKEFPVGLLVKDNTVITWKYIEKERFCQQEELSREDITVLEVNCEENYIKGEIIGKTKANQIKFTIGAQELCSLKPGYCYKISYYFDGLGFPIAIKGEDIDCPCNFELTLPKQEIKTSSGSSFFAEIKIKNTGKFDGVFEPTFTAPENFPGTLEITPKSDAIPAGKDGFFKLSGKVPDEFEGSVEIIIGATCRNIKVEKTLRVTATAPVFQISTAAGLTDVPTDENVNLTFDVTNYGDGPITVLGMIEKTDFPGKLTIEPISKDIPDKTTRTFVINGVWNSNAKVGVQYTINYSAMCGGIKKSEKVTVKSLAPGPTVTIVPTKPDEKGRMVLEGQINAKHYTIVRIVVDWGDGTKEDVKGLPAFHQYKKKGEYTIKVTIFTKEGINTTSDNAICEWDGPRPIVTVTGRDWVQPRYTIKGNIDWNTLKPGKLKVDWDDGTIDTKSDFPVSHNFSAPGVYLVVLTAIASTGEEGSTIWPIFLIPGLFSYRHTNLYDAYAN